jgi:hypothetical protein
MGNAGWRFLAACGRSAGVVAAPVAILLLAQLAAIVILF